ncbi:TIGR03792 family protein [Phormidium sp. CLA17]|uniref:TIGR03792 family protein n=1 Tax=Leptolyngbya sp. Cla-17 TaxID=2803751 RepID=UPI0014916C36|nr:TIGR03792 family protein [Leptolyngbya sp. Cla-17]MBM0741140.1 TIGR03792 family protein [Leptolyngbya sp. Cla-17]
MVIEWLRVQVAEDLREVFVQKDEEIWTAALAKHSGFLGKEVWISPQNPQEVILVIHWKTREAWKSIPQDYLDATEKRFSQEFDANTYKIIEVTEYSVRKFIQPRSK